MRFRIILGTAAVLATASLAAAQGRTAVARSAAPAPAPPPATAVPIAPGAPGTVASPFGRSAGVPPIGGMIRMPPAGVVLPNAADAWHPGMPPRSSVLYPSLYPSVTGVIPRGSVVTPSIYPGTTAVPRGSVLMPSIYPGRTAVPRAGMPGGAIPNAAPDLTPSAPEMAIPQESPRSKIVEVPRQPPAGVAPTGEAVGPGRTAVPRPSSPLTIVGPGSSRQQRPPVSGGSLQAVPRPGAGAAGGRQAGSRAQVTPPIAGNDWRTRDHRNHPRFTYRPGITVYPRYYYPRYAYPYGYGAYGLGYFYYDPYQWYAPERLYWLGPGYYGHGTFVDVGELRLRITPADAQVYVDGVYVGMAADFEQVLRALKLEIGTYHVDIVLPGYQSLSFDVQITPGRTVTYEGTLTPEP